MINTIGLLISENTPYYNFSEERFVSKVLQNIGVTNFDKSTNNITIDTASFNQKERAYLKTMTDTIEKREKEAHPNLQRIVMPDNITINGQKFQTPDSKPDISMAASMDKVRLIKEAVVLSQSASPELQNDLAEMMQSCEVIVPRDKDDNYIYPEIMKEVQGGLSLDVNNIDQFRIFGNYANGGFYINKPNIDKVDKETLQGFVDKMKTQTNPNLALQIAIAGAKSK